MNNHLKFIIPSDLKISRNASTSLDFIRGAAALLVMIGHLRNLLFVEYADVERLNLFVKLFYFVTGFGHQAVVVFFVLSGFFISSSIFRSHNQGRWSWREYLAQRMVRLWIVLIPALLLTAFWDRLGVRLFGESIYQGLPSDQHILGFSTIERLSFQTFLSNVLFLQGIATPTFGSNGPLWSLSYEFWYYMAFPCSLFIVFAPAAKVKTLYGCVLIAIGFLVGKAIALSFAIWLLGVFVIFMPHLWHKHKPVKIYATILALIPFGISLVLSVYKKGNDLSWLIGISFTLLMYLIFRYTNGIPEQSGASSTARFSKNFAGFSYSLYLLHLPPLVFLHAYLNSIDPLKWQPTSEKVLLAGFIATCTILYAWVLALVTESKTDELRHFLKRKCHL